MEELTFTFAHMPTFATFLADTIYGAYPIPPSA